MVKRGEVWLVNLDPIVGSEIKKPRPCLVISPGAMQDYLTTVIVAPMTTKGRSAPFRIDLTHAGRKGLVLLDQMRAVDKRRLTKKVGAVSSKTLSATLATLQEVFAG